MLKIEHINPYSDPRWMAFITRHDDATIFHHPDWMRTLEDTYGFRPASLAIVSDDCLVGILPLQDVRSWLTGRRGICLPFSDACAPLFTSSDGWETLLPHLPELLASRGWDHIEIRGGCADPRLAEVARFKYHQVDLDRDSERVFRQFRRTQVRQAIGKAIRVGATVEQRWDYDALREFIRLNTITRKKNGVPPQPDRFLNGIFENFIHTHAGFVNLVVFQGKVVAAGIFLCFKRILYYKYTGVDRQYLRIRPNNLMVWEAMKWGCDNGYKAFDFGRTDPDNVGLLNYKRSWAPREMDLAYYRWQKNPQVARGGKRGILAIASPMFKIMPIPLLRLAGRVLYRHAA